MTAKKEWEEELKAEQLAAARKQGREIAKRADKNFEHGRITGICAAASFFIGKDRVDIAQALLTHFCVTENTANSVLQADKRVHNMTLEYLKKYGCFNEVKEVS